MKSVCNMCDDEGIVKEGDYKGFNCRHGSSTPATSIKPRKLNNTVKEEAVNHPTHYNSGKIEVIDFIEDQKLGFNLGNAIKYIARAEHKAKPDEDLKKALWYVQREYDRRLGFLVTTTQKNYDGLSR